MSPIAPVIEKGALIIMDQSSGSEKNKIIFDYNPETLKRTLKPRTPTQEKGHPAENLRFNGPPEESLTLEISLDATNDLARGDQGAIEHGIHPQLALLELLVFPRSTEVAQSTKLLNEGQIEIGGAEYDAPLILFVWGKKRVLPVRLTNISITETIFDAQLNPIQATLSLSLEALTYSDLAQTHKGYDLYKTYHENKEKIAALAANGKRKV